MASRPDGTARLIAQDIRGRAQAGEYVAWGLKALEAGFDSPALRSLAALDLGKRPLDASAFEASREFRSAVAQLGLGVPSLEEALRQHAKDLARRMLDRTLDVDEGLAAMHREVVVPLEHEPDMMPWCSLWEGRHPNNSRELCGDALAEEVYSTAEALLASEDSA